MHRVSKLTSHLAAAPTKAVATAGSACGRPRKVLVTGAAGNIAYAILFAIGQGKLLGDDQPIDLVLLDIPPMADKMQGVVMELNDCAFPIFKSITATTDYKVAFAGVEVALLIGARPRSKGMVRADLLKANASIFEGQGKALEQYADRNVKVVVVGNPANTNALIAMKNAPSIPRENFTAMTRLDQNRAVSQLATRMDIDSTRVNNVIIWGNHSKTQYPDISHALLTLPCSGSTSSGSGCASAHPLSTSLRVALDDDKWARGEFVKTVQQRGAAIIAARGLSSAASAANACLDHIRDWILGTKPGQWVSMGVISDGSYGVPKDIIFSFPVTCVAGQWRIVNGLTLDDFSKARLKDTADELLNERKEALGY